MKIAIITSVSSNTPWATITMPNRLEYCIKHNYTMIVISESYNSALNNFGQLHNLLFQYDLIWTLDADCLITDLTKKIENISELGSNVSICEEGLGSYAFAEGAHHPVLVNAGSVVWRNTTLSHKLIDDIVLSKPEWQSYQFNIQTWLTLNRVKLEDKLKICPLRTFNSVHYYDRKIWQNGDFVYHPCGMPTDMRCQMLLDMKNQIIHE